MTGQWESGRPGRHGFSKKAAQRILRRDGFACQLAYQGCEERASVADHVVGWQDAVAFGWDPADIDDEANGQAVCPTCHDAKSTAEARRGRQRAAATRQAKRRRPPEKHPGLL